MLLSAGCRSKSPAPAASDSPLFGGVGDAGPTTFSQVAPGDTAAVIALMRLTMTQIDSALDGYTKRDTIIPAVTPDSEPRHLSLWMQDGAPRKLTVSEPALAGQASSETAYWFINGDLAVVQQPTATYALDGDRIVVWADEMLVPVGGFTVDDRMARELLIVAEAKKYLAAFGISQN